MKSNKIIYLVTIIISIIFFSCEENFEPEIQKTVLHSLVFEGQSPKIILAQTLDPFPEYAFNIK